MDDTDYSIITRVQSDGGITCKGSDERTSSRC